MRHWILVGLFALGLASSASAQLDTLTNAGACPVTGFAAGATSVTVATGCGATLPSANFNVAVCRVDTYPSNCKNASGVLYPNYEVLRVTSRSTDTLTVTRAQEGTSDANHNDGAGTYWVFLLTAKTFTDINTALGATFLTTSSNSVLTNENSGLTAGRIPYVASGPVIADSAKFQWDEANIRLGISAGTAAPSFTFHVQGTTGGVISALDSYATSSVTRFRRGNGDSSAITRVASGDSLGAFQWWGASKDDGSAGATFAASAATVRAVAREDFTTTGRGTSLEIQTAPMGGTSVATALTVNNTATTVASGAYLDLAGTGTSLRNGSNGKFVFDTSNRQMQWHPGSEARPLMQLEDAIASGGTDRTDTRLTLWGRSGVGAVSDFFTAQVNLGAIDGSNSATAYGIVADGSWTNGGGFGSNTQFILYDQPNNRHLMYHTQANPLTIQFFEGSAGRIAMGGNAARSTTDGTNLFRCFNGTAPSGTLTNGGDVYCAGGEVVASDSGGNAVYLTTLAVSSGGNLGVPGTFTLSGDDQPSQIAAATNDYAISSTNAVTVVDADQTRAITGMTGGADGRQHTLINDGASDSVLILRHDDTGSSAANRFTMMYDVVLEAGQAATFWYNSTASRWHLLSTTATDRRTSYLPFEDTDLLAGATADTKEATETWNYAVISSGTQAKVAADATHRGILRTLSSTTTNSGGLLQTALDSFRLSGGEFTEFVFNVDTTTNTTIRMGFLDTATSTDVTDGAYIEIPASTAPTCKTANNSTRTTSGTIATIATATWYRARIEVDNTAANVTCTIFDANGNSLGSQTNSANIPTGAGRETGHGYIATNSGTSAVNLVQMDYVSVGTRRAIVR